MSAASSPSSPVRPRSRYDVAADIFDPPAWEPTDRPPLEAHQIPPDGVWNLWLLEGGRGCGKTEACARYFARYMRLNPGHRGRIVAPTFGDAVEACIEGPSGLLAIDPEITWLPSAPGGAKLVWPTGSEALVFGTPAPRDVDRFRAGGNRHIDWWEEMAANPQLRRAWDQAALGLRMGEHPHSIASTTPRSTKDYAGTGSTEWTGIRNQPGVAMTHATLFDNPHNPQEWVDQMRARYEGTRLGRQELAGELLEDIEGALWTREMLDHRCEEPDELVRVVIAVDPAVTSGENADETGIVVAGLGRDGHGYVLADRTCHLPPDQWAKRVVESYNHFNADRVVAEVNNGGELVGTVLRTQDKRLPFKSLHASRGKRTRAEPIAALYEQGKVHHVGVVPQLEDELCTWVPGDTDSPDRLDALVWALTELMLKGGPGSLSVPQGEIPRTDPSRRRELRDPQRGGQSVPDFMRRSLERGR